MRQKTLLVILMLAMSLIPVVYAQEDITPVSLEVKIYTDGSALVQYIVESDPTKVRVSVDLFGDSYNNLIIRDEDGLPLDSESSGSSLTIDSIGASELNIVYTTYDLTIKDGPIWDLNLTSPVTTTVTLPQGAAIFDLGNIPLDLGSINGAQYIELPAGEVYVSFLLSMPNLSAEAQSAIDKAGSYLSSLENQDYILTEARTELAQAQQLLGSDQFVDAKNTANRAITTADEIVNSAKSAATEIALASSAIEQAQNEDRTAGITLAQDTLSSAETYYSQGMYTEADVSAKQASQLAFSADKPRGGNTLLYVGILIVLAAAIGGYYYMQNIRDKKPPQTPIIEPETEEKTVDQARIFEEHKDLRLEDREVIKFLSENKGEAFATEIRDRFDLPRSSAWRLIRRLVSLEIVEEVKVGNQSLVRIRKKYLR